MSFKAMPFDKVEDMRKAFFDGKCDALTADLSNLYATRVAYAPNPNYYLVWPQAISKEPLALVVRHGDHQFADIVRWSLFAMIEAEEYGITSANVDQAMTMDHPLLKRLLGVTPGMGKALGVDDKWFYDIIKQVGNYGQVYERNVGPSSLLEMEFVVDPGRHAVRLTDSVTLTLKQVVRTARTGPWQAITLFCGCARLAGCKPGIRS